MAYGVPCQHVICSILHMNNSDFKKFVDERLRIPIYMKTYSGMIHPILNQRSQADGIEGKLQLPSRYSKPDKPKKARKRDPKEERKRKHMSTLQCSVCLELGYSKRSYKNNPNSANRVKQKVKFAIALLIHEFLCLLFPF